MQQRLKQMIGLAQCFALHRSQALTALHYRCEFILQLKRRHWDGRSANCPILIRERDRSSYITGQLLLVDGGFEATCIGLHSMRVRGKNGQGLIAG